MADEITLNSTLTLANGSLKASHASSKKITQTTARASQNVQTIGTTYEAIAVPTDIATPGVCRFLNLGPTNYVEIGVEVSSAFYPLVRLKVGECYPFRLAAGVTAYAKANTAAVDLECVILAD